ncbi:glycoside hydrolase family 75 protein [Streptomyces sp. NPDC006638]|uniref:glycoside hydrolase family 75 protein n=1 Tax=Streptomyces sp. NPDC006638 TaxID=3157183 RepID=UPI0033BCBC36
MARRTRALGTVGTALLAAALPATVLPAEALSAAPAAPPAGAAGPRGERRAPGQEGTVRAADLLAATTACTPVSKGKYRTDAGAAATVPVCGTKDAVFWKADMDIDCDGQVTAHCNTTTDPWFQESTAFAQSDGKPLNSEKLPFVVVPAPSELWSYPASGIRGGGVVAVVHGGRVRYAVVGDTGPVGIIGEASYATAESLGIPAHPQRGGVASGVTYILFKNTRVSPIENHDEAVRLGDALAKKFVRENGGAT